MKNLIKDVEHGYYADSLLSECQHQHQIRDSIINLKDRQGMLLKDTLIFRTTQLNIQLVDNANKDAKIKNQNKIIRTLYAVSIGLAAIIFFK